MIVYRLCRSIYSGDLSGSGSKAYGGRWNSRGVALLYASSSISLSLCEKLVNAIEIPGDYVAVSYEIPVQVKIFELNADKLPAGWDAYPYHPSTAKMGDEFINAGKYMVMKVPSAIVKSEYNYLINPLHKDMESIKIISVAPFSFDRRFFGK